MDAEAYFPADISVVPHEDDTVSAAATSSSFEDEKRPSETSQSTRRLMHGRKRRDPPLLSTIEEVPSMTSLLPADTSIYCLLCYNKISGAVPNFVKPCQCQYVFVHTTCAIENDTFLGATCTQCLQKYRPMPDTPRPSPTKSSSSKKSTPLMSKQSSSSAIVPANAEPPTFCALCQNQNYRNPEWPERNDAKLIRPCFCQFLVHHGCITEHLKKEKTCDWCGVKYRYYRYGSIGDFCCRYAFQHICYLIFFIFLIFFFVLAFQGSYVFRHKLEAATISLSILALFFLAVIIGTCIFAIKHTFLTRLPRFRRRYGKVTVVPYDPDVKSKKEVLRTLKTLRDQSDLDDQVPLDQVRAAPTPAESLESDVEAPRTDPCDLSLGQQMFGISSNPRIFSSTPMIQKQKVTVFGSSNA